MCYLFFLLGELESKFGPWVSGIGIRGITPGQRGWEMWFTGAVINPYRSSVAKVDLLYRGGREARKFAGNLRDLSSSKSPMGEIR